MNSEPMVARADGSRVFEPDDESQRAYVSPRGVRERKEGDISMQVEEQQPEADREKKKREE